MTSHSDPSSICVVLIGLAIVLVIHALERVWRIL